MHCTSCLLQTLANSRHVWLQYMGHRLEPRNEAMRRSKVLYTGSNGGLMYGSHHNGPHEYNAEVQHAAHSLSGLGQVSWRGAEKSRPSFLIPGTALER